MEVCSLKFGHTFKENLKFFLKNPKQLKTITENCLKTINIILSTYTLRYVLEKNWNISEKHFSFIFFFQISVNFQNSSGTTMTVTMTANFVIQNSPRLLPTYIITKEKFETDRHVHHSLTDALPGDIQNLGQPEKHFFDTFFNFGF